MTCSVVGCAQAFVYPIYARKPAFWAAFAVGNASLLLILGLGFVYGDHWLAWDNKIATLSYGLRAPAWSQFMLAVSTLNSNAAINIYSGFIILYLLYRRAWQPAFWFVWIVQGGLVLNVLLKHAFSRARPDVYEPLLHLSSYSFPSGHVAGTVLFYGVLVFAYAQAGPPLRVLLVASLLAILLVALTAFSRVYLGVHFFSDVLAGAAMGGTWLSLHLWYLSRGPRRLRAAPTRTGLS